MHTVLGMDCSSTTLGWCLWDGSHVRAHNTLVLKGDLTARIKLAYTLTEALLIKQAPDAVAIEGPTTRFANHTIAQQRVCGVVLLAIAQVGLVHVEIAPATAKKMLTGTGKASKTLMIANARGLMGECDEHQADALGVAMAAWSMVRAGEVAA